MCLILKMLDGLGGIYMHMNGDIFSTADKQLSFRPCYELLNLLSLHQ